MSATPKDTKPDFDEEFLQTLKEWKEKNKIRDDDAVYLLVEMFRLHQKHWDALRQRQMPSLDQFRNDVAAVTESAKSFREKTEDLIDALLAHPTAGPVKTIPLTARLRRAGQEISAKRVQRVRRKEGLQVSRRQRKLRRWVFRRPSGSERRRPITSGAGTLWQTRRRTGPVFGCCRCWTNTHGNVWRCIWIGRSGQ